MTWSKNLIMFLVLAGLDAPTLASNLSLSCDRVSNGRREPDLIRKLAPDVAARTSPHVLQIRTETKTLTFADKPPYDEPLAGLRYYFCDRKDGFVLVKVENDLDDNVFTGVLIHKETGKTTRAGLDVIFSSDKRAYFATEQPDGMDGSVWRIYSVDGKLSWSGYSFIPEANNDGVLYAFLGNQKWTATGEFTAEAFCLHDTNVRWAVKLTKINGKWDWHPKKKCP